MFFEIPKLVFTKEFFPKSFLIVTNDLSIDNSIVRVFGALFLFFVFLSYLALFSRFCLQSYANNLVSKLTLKYQPV